jgi:hypothetical protein
VVREFVSIENFYGSPSNNVAATTLSYWMSCHIRSTPLLHVGGCAGRLVTSPLALPDINLVKRKKLG